MCGGMNFAKYETGAQAEQQITIIVEQTGNDLTVAFNTASGGGGKGVARLTFNSEFMPSRSDAKWCSRRCQ